MEPQNNKRGPYKEYLRSSHTKVPRRTLYSWRKEQGLTEADDLDSHGNLSSNSQSNFPCISGEYAAQDEMSQSHVEIVSGGPDSDNESLDLAVPVNPESETDNLNISLISSIHDEGGESSGQERCTVSDFDAELELEVALENQPPIPEPEYEEYEENVDSASGDDSDEDNVSMEDRQEGGHEDENEEPMHPGTHLTKSQFQLLLIAHVYKHKMSGQALEDLFKLLDLLVPGVAPKSAYLFKNTLSKYSGSSKIHIYCAGCFKNIGIIGSIVEQNGTCLTCGKAYDVHESQKKGHFFLTLSVEEQIRQVLEKTDDSRLVKKSEFQQNVLSDITSGRKIQEMLRNGELTDEDLTLLWNLDGVPLFKSVNYSITPIQFTINELPYTLRKKNVLMCGLWFGQAKPNPNTFLQPMLVEAEKLSVEGMEWCAATTKRRINSKVFFVAASCDSIARPSIRNTIQFNGNSGCDWCLHEGERVEKGNGFVRCYPLTEQPELRTSAMQEEFAVEAVETDSVVHGVKGPSCLSLLPQFDIVEGFVVDYMHAVLLGVARQFTSLWFDSPNHDMPYYIGTFCSIVDEKLLSVKPPSEITRKSRDIGSRKYWKASEWRSFLLYYSPLALRGVLPHNYFQHWMLLVCCTHELLRERIHVNTLVQVEAGFRVFVSGVARLYGIEHVSFNIHQLTHIADCVRNWGPLWATSAFPFEGNNQFLLGLFHGKTHAPEQIVSKCSLKMKMSAAAAEILVNANEATVFLYSKLSHSGRYLPVNSKRIGEVFLYGKENKKEPSLSTKAALERFLGTAIPAGQKFAHYKRFSNGQFVCHASSYDEDKSRKNDIVLLKNREICRVKELVVVGCDCEIQCNCNADKACIVLQRLQTEHRNFFSSSGISSSHIFQISHAAETIVVEIGELERKCVAIQNDLSHFAFCMPNQFETD